MDRFDPFVKYSDIYGDVINWEKDPMNKPQNQNKYFFSDGKTYYEQICKMLKLMSVFKDAFNQIYNNEDEISSAWENFVDNLSATAIYGEEVGVDLTWTDTSVNFAFTIPGGRDGEDGVGIQSITFNSDYTMTITLTDGQTYTSYSLKGPQGEQGIQGEPGPQGEPGEGLNILDTYPTLQDLQTAHPTGQPGDGYQVGTDPTFTLYIWSVSRSQWVPAGTLGSVSPSLTAPLMDGTASPGSSDLYSRGDHVHPTDTSRASVSDLNDLSDVINESMILTDQEFTYRQSPANHDGLANIDKIKGNTLIFNQLVRNGNLENTGDWGQGGSRSTLSVENNIGTATLVNSLSTTYQNYRPVQLVQGHKILIHYEFKVPRRTERVFGCENNNTGSAYVFNNMYNVVADTWHTVNALHTVVDGGEESIAICYFYTNRDGYQLGDQYQFKNLFVIDLTQMFGAGNEPTTVEEFTSLFPLPYYNYNTGSLLSFNGTGLKAVGFNQWDEIMESGSLSGTGQPTVDANKLRTKNYIRVMGGKTYYFKITSACSFHFWDGNFNYIGNNYFSSAQAFSIPSNAMWMKFRTADAYGTEYKNDICINISDTSKNGTYESYIENTIDLPISTYFPTGMKSAGSIYDELTESKATTRIGIVDLGSLNWNYATSGQGRFYSSGISSLVKPVSSNSNIANIKCPFYSTISAGSVYAGITGIAIDTGGAIWVYDASQGTDAGAFKTAMNGVYLFYELATPTEQDIDIELTHFIYRGGTEQLLPINTATPTTSPILCDMTYMSISDEILYLYNNSGASADIEELENDVANIKTQIGSESTTPMTGILGRVNTLESNVTDLGSDVTDLETAIGSEATEPKTGILGRVNALESDVSAIETEIGSDATSPVTGLAGRIKTIENALNNLKGKVVYEYTSTTDDQGLTNVQLDMSDLNNATHIEVIYSVYKNGNDTLSTGIIPYKFYDPTSVAFGGTVSEHQIDQDRGRSWGISSTGLLTINSCRTYYPDSSEVSNSYLIIRQVVLYKFTRANSLI